MSPSAIGRGHSEPKMKTLIAALLSAATTIYGQYSVEITGPQRAHAGETVYLSLQAKAETYAHLYVSASVPAGWNVTLFCGSLAGCFKSSDGRRYQYGGVNPVIVRVNVPAAASGANAVAFAFVMGGVAVSKQWSFDVGPPKLDVAKWEANMFSLGAKWCKTDTVLSFGVESQVWYYDGARVYFQIADRTQDKKWEDCALWIAKQYRDYVIKANGGQPAYRLFPHGLEMAYRRTGDETYKQAVLLMAKNAPYAVSGGGVSTKLIRETAYVLNCYLAAERLGAGRHAQTERAVSQLLGHYSMLFDTHSYELHQTFFDGLAAEALIDWYEATGDLRVPAAIKRMLDWHWFEGWNGKQLVYNPDPLGATCENSCGKYASELIALSMPAFGWYSRLTGDATYRERGDVMWSHMHDTDIAYTGKIFSQNYRWTFAYLSWRNN